MAKRRKRVAAEAVATTTSDLGTQELRQHIDVAVLETIQAGVHVARVRCLHEVLYADKDPKKQLGQREYDAAERYRRDYETAAGALEDSRSGQSNPWARTIPDVQIDAQTALREAQQFLGPIGSALLDAGAVLGASLSRLAAMLMMPGDTERAKLAFVVALGALGEHYEGPRRARSG